MLYLFSLSLTSFNNCFSFLRESSSEAFSVTSSTLCMIYFTLLNSSRTGEWDGRQYLIEKPPPSEIGLGISYFIKAIESAVLVARTLLIDALMLLSPIAVKSLGLSGKTSKISRPIISSLFITVDFKYLSKLQQFYNLYLK